MQPPLSTPPDALVPARTLTHQACQWPSKAARANISAKADDSHSNLGWDHEHKALISHGLDEGLRFQLGFNFSTASLLWLVDNAIVERLELSSQSEQSVGEWVDAHLIDAGMLATEHAQMPYELDVQTSYSDFAHLQQQTAVLGQWYDYANNALQSVVETHGSQAITPATVRCWPHHFDIATLFALEDGDPESARSIGVGLSPGDGSYAEPYFYCTPWPPPEIASLPKLAPPLDWHTQGFVSIICKSSNLAANSEIVPVLTESMTLAQRCLSSATNNS
ncbi:MAG: hypothetical protein ACR2PZ_26705 [Pseudomonadales bacterium]